MTLHYADIVLVAQVFYDPSPIGATLVEIGERAAKLSEPIKLGGSRLVVHLQTSPEAVEDFLELVRTVAEEKRRAGFVKPAENKVNGYVNGNGHQDVYVRVR